MNKTPIQSHGPIPPDKNNCPSHEKIIQLILSAVKIYDPEFEKNKKKRNRPISSKKTL